MAKKKKKNNSPEDDIKIEKELIETAKDIDEKVKKNIEIKNKEAVKSRREVIREEKLNYKDISKENKSFKHPFIHGFLVLVLLVNLGYFIVNLFYKDTDSISTLVSNLLLMLFTLMFVSASITTNRKNKSSFFISGFLLLGYFIFELLMTFGIISFPNTRVIDFTGSKLTEVVEWSEKNKIDLIQQYEYSDMISEYHVISQDVAIGTKIKDIDSITVAISEGPNPTKEIMVPSMIGWDSERVLKYVKDNHLSNVLVEFVESTKEVNTVIEQSKSGNLRRDEELKLIFSYGGELEYEEVKLSDLTQMSKFEAMFYMKQHQLNYEFEDVFSNDIKSGYVVKQSIKAGTMVKVNSDKVIISISKGPEIKVPDLTKLNMTEVTDWVIKNKLKLEFIDKYDDTILENNVISANYKNGDIISEGTVIEVVISRGKLVMLDFKTYDEFREWADKYGIEYEEQHEFSDDIKAGEAISYSYKKGETIKNNDSIVVIVSDGQEAVVPNVVGSTQSQATSKLKSVGFGYSLVYSYSNTVAKGSVVKQSISGGSKVAKGTTITLTISNGKKPASSSSGGTSTTPTCSPKTYTVGRNLNNVFSSYSGYSEVSSALYSFFSSNYPNVKISVVGVSDTGMSSGSYVGGIGPGSSITSCNSTAYVIQIAK